MNPFLSLLRRNHNYRNTWIGQVVSEIGDHFNNIAVFGLVLAQTHNGMVVTGVMLARAIPAILAGPLAGVLLDRFDRQRMMIASDLVRAAVTQFGFRLAFVVNSLSFLVSALCISRLFLPGRGFRPPRTSVTESDVVRPWHAYVEGMRYMRSRPLILGIGMIAVGWATGGGAAQILFSIFGEMVFNRGPAGIGTIWGY